MNQIESLYQPSFNHPYEVHPQQGLYAPGPSSLVPSPQHFVPQSPLASSPSFPPPPPQQQRQSSFGHDFRGGAGPGHVNSRMPQAAQNQQSPLNISRNQSPYTTAAGFSQPISAPAQSPAKHPTPPFSHAGSASPQKRPMAAPPLPASVQRQQSPHNNSNASTSQPSSPQSIAHAAREKERVALLLEINLELLQEMNKLQAEGKGGATNPQQAAMLKAQGQSDKMAAEEFIQVLHRVQSNLGYLYNQPDMQLLNPANQNQPQAGKKGPPHPPHFMRPPPSMPSLDDKYSALRRLFPGWTGRDAPSEGQTM